jgi:hypothetical protein
MYMIVYLYVPFINTLGEEGRYFNDAKLFLGSLPHSLLKRLKIRMHTDHRNGKSLHLFLWLHCDNHRYGHEMVTHFP